jgi:TRAP-type mannitol/chloroaromatic compound transport system permease large subunit
VFILVLVVLGSIYTGWATPTEAAAVGVVGSLFFALLTRSSNWEVFKEALMGSVKTSCMIMWIVCGAAYLSVAVGYLGITRSLSVIYRVIRAISVSVDFFPIDHVYWDGVVCWMGFR